MPQYDYKCDVCSHEYIEVRDAEHPQWKVGCVVTGCEGTLKEVI
jgi:predicted nucleic acid-binding Zn ribbon protein